MQREHAEIDRRKMKEARDIQIMKVLQMEIDRGTNWGGVEVNGPVHGPRAERDTSRVFLGEGR